MIKFGQFQSRENFLSFIQFILVEDYTFLSIVDLPHIEVVAIDVVSCKFASHNFKKNHVLGLRFYNTVDTEKENLINLFSVD